MTGQTNEDEERRKREEAAELDNKLADLLGKISLPTAMAKRLPEILLARDRLRDDHNEQVRRGLNEAEHFKREMEDRLRALVVETDTYAIALREHNIPLPTNIPTQPIDELYVGPFIPPRLPLFTLKAASPPTTPTRSSSPQFKVPHLPASRTSPLKRGSSVLRSSPTDNHSMPGSFTGPSSSQQTPQPPRPMAYISRGRKLGSQNKKTLQMNVGGAVEWTETQEMLLKKIQLREEQQLNGTTPVAGLPALTATPPTAHAAAGLPQGVIVSMQAQPVADQQPAQKTPEEELEGLAARQRITHLLLQQQQRLVLQERDPQAQQAALQLLQRMQQMSQQEEQAMQQLQLKVLQRQQQQQALAVPSQLLPNGQQTCSTPVIASLLSSAHSIPQSVIQVGPNYAAQQMESTTRAEATPAVSATPTSQLPYTPLLSQEQISELSAQAISSAPSLLFSPPRAPPQLGPSCATQPTESIIRSNVTPSVAAAPIAGYHYDNTMLTLEQLNAMATQRMTMEIQMQMQQHPSQVARAQLPPAFPPAAAVRSQQNGPQTVMNSLLSSVPSTPLSVPRDSSLLNRSPIDNHSGPSYVTQPTESPTRVEVTPSAPARQADGSLLPVNLLLMNALAAQSAAMGMQQPQQVQPLPVQPPAHCPQPVPVAPAQLPPTFVPAAGRGQQLDPASLALARTDIMLAHRTLDSVQFGLCLDYLAASGEYKL